MGAGVGFAGTGDGFVVASGAGVCAIFAFAGGVFGVGEGFAAVFVFTGTGTSTTPPSGAMNGLPVFGSIV